MSNYVQVVGVHPTGAPRNFTRFILFQVTISSVVFAFRRAGALASLFLLGCPELDGFSFALGCHDRFDLGHIFQCSLASPGTPRPFQRDPR